MSHELSIALLALLSMVQGIVIMVHTTQISALRRRVKYFERVMELRAKEGS